MLVLTRKQDQVIKIGETVSIQVLGIGTTKVKIGIEAPSEVEIRREEVPPRA